jgi:hypothetical protein
MKKYINYLILLTFLAMNFGRSFAAEQPANNEEKPMTRAEIVQKITATDFFKRKIGDLVNWSVGYDITKINRTNLAPTISLIQVVPTKAPPDDRTIVFLMAKVSDPSGPDSINGVRADLSSIDKLPNRMLVDNGLWGDQKANDGIYTLQTSVGPGVTGGEKDIPVAVANKAGWVAVNKANLNVQANPIISEGRSEPAAVKANGKNQVLLTVKVDNPGRQEDLKGVYIDLSAVGLDSKVAMWDDGTHGDLKAGDKIFSVIAVPKEGTSFGAKKLAVHASNLYGGAADGEILLTAE